MTSRQTVDEPDLDKKNLLICDRVKAQRLLQDIRRRQSASQPVDKLQAKLDRLLTESTRQVGKRRAQLPAISYPGQLPVADKRDDIAAAIRDHQVVVVAGETGSGKTTQIPKICLELGRGIHGLIGHTQPRRLAARTVASRISEELNVSLGQQVGYQVRFTDHSNENTLIKLMTDGILLAEIQQDPWLNRYDTIIVDEAHERSLNIDFLLGYLKQLLQRRPDLKVIITSATIDVERFSSHFDSAPVVQVSGRTFPVEVRYRPVAEEEDQPEAIVATVDEILREQKKGQGVSARDILVFLAGERHIRETALALRRAGFPDLEVTPLYSRLSIAEQNRIFQPHRGVRIVLATNVAETSITVPGIGYVIDPGYARISRYSFRTKVQRLPVEPISQASANQRTGRSGRISEGACYRLYSEEDFQSRPEFTEPEILRSNLSSVILQMARLKLGGIRDFPFVEQPDNRLINDGYRLLEELQALDGKGELTDIGRRLSRFSIDPRFARMCVAAAQSGCLKEVLIIVSAATIQDPRERPADRQQAADQQHRRFWEDNSDFLAWLKLWDYVEQQRQDLSNNQFRQLCKKEYLSWLRLREWRDLHTQLRVMARQLDYRENREPANYQTIHRALLTGLLGNTGNLGEERIYNGPRNRRFSIFPGSSLFKKTPKWVMAGELLETSKLYAHSVAKIEPEWLLSAAQHLVKRHHSEPYYDTKRGQVMAFEKVTLYGLVLADRRRVAFGPIDPPLAREIFVRSALVEGQYWHLEKNTPKFWQHNQSLFAELEELEAKSRRRDIVVDDRQLVNFFLERIPEQVVNLKGFEHWRKQAEQQDSELLCLPRKLVMQHQAEEVTADSFPNEMAINGEQFALSYEFAPGTDNDGVNIHVPVHQLHLLSEQQLAWLVPGLLQEKCLQLVKGLPKQWRKHFVPVPATMDRLFEQSPDYSVSLFAWLSHQLNRAKGVKVPEDAWQQVQMDDFYRFNIRVLDDNGKQIDSGRELAPLRERYRHHLQSTIRSVGDSFERQAIQQWNFGELPESHRLEKKGVATLAYPALVDREGSVDLRLLDNPEQATMESRRGVARLILLALGQSAKYLKKNLFKSPKAALKLASFGNRGTLLDDLLCAAVRHAALDGQALPRNERAFQSCIERARGDLTGLAGELETLVSQLADEVVAVHAMLGERENKPHFAPIADDIKHQLANLFAEGFLFHTPLDWLRQYPRYLQGVKTRIDKTDAQIQKDLGQLDQLQPWLAHFAPCWPEQGSWQGLGHEELATYRWMLEEFRLSLFAQPMKTRIPVSAKRMQKQWQKAEACLPD